MGAPISLTLAGALIASALVVGFRETPRSRVTAIAAVLVAAAVLRAAPIDAGLPYLRYVDEGHVLHRSARIASVPTWDPGWYRYPPLLAEATGAATFLYDSITPGEVFPDGFDPHPEFYDDGMPSELVLTGRILIVLASIGTVALALALGVTLVGWRAGLLAGIVAAVMPALVARGAIVTPHTVAGLLVTASVLAAARLRSVGRPSIAAGAAGGAAGLAFTATYFTALSGLVAAVVSLTWTSKPWRYRIGLLAISALACGAAIAVFMPGVWLDPDQVTADIRTQTDIYSDRPGEGGYVSQLLGWSEVGPLIAALAAFGTVVLLRRQDSRLVTVGALMFVVAASVFLTRFDFRPVQTITPLFGLLAVAAGVGIDRLAGFIRSDRYHGLAWVASAAAVAASALVIGVRPDLESQRETVDTRTPAVDAIAAHAAPTDDVLVVSELTVADSELEGLAANVVEVPWSAAISRLCRFDLVLAGVPPDSLEDSWWLASAPLQSVASFGSKPTPDRPDFWRTNDQQLTVWRVNRAACELGSP